MPDEVTRPPPLQLVEGSPIDPPEPPAYLRKTRPPLGDLFVVDARVHVADFLKTITAGGFAVVNLHDGRLVITRQPEDFRP